MTSIIFADEGNTMFAKARMEGDGPVEWQGDEDKARELVLRCGASLGLRFVTVAAEPSQAVDKPA